jgi:heterotetrameric sarcosine oxidase gamma subunit
VVEPPVAMSPLADLQAPSIRAPNIDLTERPFLVKLTLRGDTADGGFMIAAARALSLAPPAQPGNGVYDGSLTILCLAPDEWLVVSEPGVRDLVACLRQALAGRHATAVDVSCATATIAVSGSRAALLLRKICSIDLARQESRGRCCWQTRIGPFAVLIHRRAADQGFDLHVARSYARSFWLWLSDAAAEFGT